MSVNLDKADGDPRTNSLLLFNDRDAHIWLEAATRNHASITDYCCRARKYGDHYSARYIECEGGQTRDEYTQPRQPRDCGNV